MMMPVRRKVSCTSQGHNGPRGQQIPHNQLSAKRRNNFKNAKPLLYRHAAPRTLASTLLNGNSREKKSAILQLKREGKTDALIFIAVFCEDPFSRMHTFKALDGNWEATTKASEAAAMRRAHVRRHSGQGEAAFSTEPLKGYYLPREEFISKLTEIIRSP
ncbi:hypothetical protein JW721_02655 [Candidatus Micrarchaeota archaeon]|nr:hypothetical protein [Candidatus Micrarchaeota archaeon]